MNKYLMPVALTGGCALLYLLYHIQKRPKNKKSRNKDEKQCKLIAQIENDIGDIILHNNLPEDDSYLEQNDSSDKDSHSNENKDLESGKFGEESLKIENVITKTVNNSPNLKLELSDQMTLQNSDLAVQDLDKISESNNMDSKQFNENKILLTSEAIKPKVADKENNSTSTKKQCLNSDDIIDSKHFNEIKSNNIPLTALKDDIENENCEKFNTSNIVVERTFNRKSFKKMTDSVAIPENKNGNNNEINSKSKSNSEIKNNIREITNHHDVEREISHTPDQENATSDAHSSASYDSGQGSSEVDHEVQILSQVESVKRFIVYQFKVPQNLVGRLIGKRGAYLNKLKSSSKADVLLLTVPDDEYKLCSVEGHKKNVQSALEMIREFFPLSQFPSLTMEQVNTPVCSPQHQPTVNRQILQMELPPGVVVEVQASAVITCGEIWLQQPLHPTFSALNRLHQCLNLNYGDGSTTPPLSLPIPDNTVCVSKINNHWLRCQVLCQKDALCTVTLLDIGGHVTLPFTLLRQIRADYISLPFQATHCYLYGIQPNSETGWTEEGRLALQEISKRNMLYASIAAYSQDGVPLVNIYQRQYSQYNFINKMLVDMGHAKWMKIESDS